MTTPLDRLAERYGPGSDPTYPIFAALWEPCTGIFRSERFRGLEALCPICNDLRYVRRSRAESESRLLLAAKAAGYRGVAISLNADGSWEADIEGMASPPTGASIRIADDPYEALAEALAAHDFFGREVKP